MTEAEPRDRLAAALVEMAGAADDNIQRSDAIRGRALRLLEQIDGDVPLADLMRRESGPRIVELLSANLATLSEAGATLRGTQAEALRAEGLTMEQIADLFGVTRQRVSALLQASRSRAAPNARGDIDRT